MWISASQILWRLQSFARVLCRMHWLVTQMARPWSIGATPSQAEPKFRHSGAMEWPCFWWIGAGNTWKHLETPGNTWKHLETIRNHQKHHQTSSNITAHHRFGGYEYHDTRKMRMSRTLGKHLKTSCAGSEVWKCFTFSHRFLLWSCMCW